MAGWHPLPVWEKACSPTSRHEEGDAEPALQHPLPQSRQAGPIEGERPADKDVQHDTEALQGPNGHKSAQAQVVPVGAIGLCAVLMQAMHSGPYPDVQLGAFVLLPLKDFRGCIRGAATPCGEGFS